MALALALAVSATAQTSSSAVAGTVAIPQTEWFRGASVTVVNEASGEERKVVTNRKRSNLLSPGCDCRATYTVPVQACRIPGRLGSSIRQRPGFLDLALPWVRSVGGGDFLDRIGSGRRAGRADTYR